MKITQSLLSWRSFHGKDIQSRLCFRASAFVFSAAAILALLLSALSTTFAGSGTWKLNPGSGDWNTDANWTPATSHPNGSADTATFDVSNTTAVSLSLNTEVNGIVFNAGASAFTITAKPSFTLTISGVGITNNSGTTQNFVTAVDTANNLGTIAFTNSATAGSLTAFTVNGGEGAGAPGSIVQFFGTSTASNATFTVNGGMLGSYAMNSVGGLVEFLDSSTAGNGIFTLNNAHNFNGPGIVNFFGTSTAGNGNFTLMGNTTLNGAGAQMNFHDSSSAGNGTFTINGGAGGTFGESLLAFSDSSTPSNGIFIVNGGLGVNGASGGSIFFGNTPAGAASATVIANGGEQSDTGGTINIPALSFSTASTARLANGATFTSTGGTTFKASYTGGTGNDLTLTVQ